MIVYLPVMMKPERKKEAQKEVKGFPWVDGSDMLSPMLGNAPCGKDLRLTSCRR